jgi:hypothetical protein
MRENRTSGTVRGAPGNGRSYREIALGEAQRILPGESPGREGGIERFPCKG